MDHWKVGPREADNKKLGEFLRVLRIQADFSRATVAHRVELSSEYLRLIERGVRSPVDANLRKLLDVYKTPYIRGLDCLVIGDVCVEFTGRIKEPRGANVGLVQKANIPAALSRTNRLGHILELLVLSDDETLKTVHAHLVHSRRNPSL